MDSITRNWYITAGVLISATGTIAGILADQNELIWVAIAIAGNSFFLHVILSKTPLDPNYPKAPRSKYKPLAKLAAGIAAILLTAGCTFAFGVAMDFWAPFWGKAGRTKAILIASFENEKEQDLPIGGPLADGIRDGIRKYPMIEVRRIEEEVLDPEGAQAIGREQKGAVFMIWGRVNTLQGDSVNLTTNFEVLKEFDNAYISKLANDASKQGRILPVGEKIKMEVQQALVKEFKCTVLLATGIIAYIEDDWSSATAIFAEAISTCESENAGHNTHIAYYHMGNCLYKQGEFAEAKAKFEKAAALAPNDPDYANAVQMAAEANEEGTATDFQDEDVNEHPSFADDGIIKGSDDVDENEKGDPEIKKANSEPTPLNATMIKGNTDVDPDVAKYLGKKVSDNRLQGGIVGDLNLIYLDGKYGFVNREKVIVIPPQFTFVGQFSEGRAILMENENYGFIDTEGKQAIPPTYEDAMPFSEGLAGVSKHTRWGFIDKTGKTVIPFEYDDVSEFSEGVVQAKRNGKYGYLDKQGKVVIPFALSEGEPCQEGMILAKNEKGYAFYRKSGQIAFEVPYVGIRSFSNGLAVVSDSKLFGYIDMTGKLAIKLQFLHADSFVNGKAKVRNAGKPYFIDKTGKCIQDCP